MENPNETNRDENRFNEENASQKSNPTGQQSTPKTHSVNPVTPPNSGTQNPLSGQFGEKQESQEFRNQPGVSSQHQASNQPSGEAGNSDAQSGFSAGRANVSGSNSASNVSGSAQHEHLSGSSKENEGRQKQEGDDIDPALQGGKSA